MNDMVFINAKKCNSSKREIVILLGYGKLPRIYSQLGNLDLFLTNIEQDVAGARRLPDLWSVLQYKRNQVIYLGKEMTDISKFSISTADKTGFKFFRKIIEQ